jgi:preprotein translocase subunit SecB
MKPSPLQLLRYFTPEISCSANLAFDPAREAVNGPDQLSVSAVVARQKTPDNLPGHSWSVEMTITQSLREGNNFPYKFNLALIGFFVCKDGFATPADEEQFVRVNGSSMLYGASRELVRSLTSSGPWGELFLPTLSFYDKASKPQAE